MKMRFKPGDIVKARLAGGGPNNMNYNKGEVGIVKAISKFDKDFGTVQINERTITQVWLSRNWRLYVENKDENKDYRMIIL